VEILALKLILTPTLVSLASLAGRRWGPAVSGWLVGLPLTSGPIIFFLALGHGPSFARAAAVGTLMGTVSQAVFCLAYAWMAAHPSSGLLSLAAGVLAFAGATTALQRLTPPLALLFPGVVLALGLVLRFMPRGADAPVEPRPLPAWDIPARMTVATAYVVLLTALAPTLGPHLTGLAAPFPLYALILAAFAHHLEGSASAIRVLRGLLFGLFSFAGFFVVVSICLGSLPLALTFALAAAVAVILQGGSLLMLRRARH